ncbi:TetR/AcrR family transcriptional regulator [Williamsia sp. MIQD14]|uniref:TetR/AcrR family transcriptional regulator n=1 Tax=Williamsia sp. MIQD14 TaxID=3425703 RepID=UPI003DA14C48
MTDTSEDARVARTRGDVSRAALEVLTKQGWDAVSHAHIARVAGYSKTTLYTHWPSKIDLVGLALDALGDMPHSVPTGDIRTDLINELREFRAAVVDIKLDRILIVLAQWGTSVEEIADIRTRLIADGEGVARAMFARIADDVIAESAIHLLSGVVVCPALMHGQVPDDKVIETSVDIILGGIEAVQGRPNSPS